MKIKDLNKKIDKEFNKFSKALDKLIKKKAYEVPYGLELDLFNCGPLFNRHLTEINGLSLKEIKGNVNKTLKTYLNKYINKNDWLLGIETTTSFVTTSFSGCVVDQGRYITKLLFVMNESYYKKGE